jgi:hypothetical protein
MRAASTLSRMMDMRAPRACSLSTWSILLGAMHTAYRMSFTPRSAK